MKFYGFIDQTIPLHENRVINNERRFLAATGAIYCKLGSSVTDICNNILGVLFEKKSGTDCVKMFNWALLGLVCN